MVQITEDSRPMCAKESCDRPALTLLNGIWLCGECLAVYCQKQEKLKQKMMLEE